MQRCSAKRTTSPKSARNSEGLYEKAIEEGGSVHAMFNLGILLEHGADGVAEDAV